MASTTERDYPLETGHGAAPVEPAPPTAAPRLSFERLIAFVSPALPIATLSLPLGLLLPPYFTSYVGLSLAVVGLSFSAVRLIDIGFDPLMGWILDRTRTRWGQARPWMVLGTLITAGSILMLFLAPKGASAIFLTVGLLILYGGTSIIGVAQPAWAARLAPDYNERSRMYAWMQIAGSLGTTLIFGVPMVAGFLRTLPPGAEVHMMGVALAALMPLTLAWTLWRVPEPDVPVAHAGADQKVKLREYIDLLKRPNILRLVVSSLFIALGPAISSTLFLFFWNSARGYSLPAVNLIILVYFAGALLSVPAWVRLANVIGKSKAFIWSALGYIVIFPTMAFIPRGQLAIVATIMFMVGLTFAAGTFLVRAMAADAADEARLDTGVDRLGLIYALLASTSKIGSAVSVGIAYVLLGFAGFNPKLGTHNTAPALQTLEFMFVGTPAVLTFIGLLAFLGYKLDRDTYARIHEALAQRDAETAQAAGRAAN